MSSGPIIQVSPQFAAAMPAEPQPAPEVVQLTAMAVSPQTREELSCQQMLNGEIRSRAVIEAAKALPEVMSNSYALAAFGTDVLKAVNESVDQMLDQRPPADIPELQKVMKSLSRDVHDLGKKYDPSDEKARKKYEGAKAGILSKFNIGKTFMEEFFDDIDTLKKKFEKYIEALEGKQYQLLENVAYYDKYYRLNEQEIDNLIYKIAVMEIIRDMAVQKTNLMPESDPAMGNHLENEKNQIGQFVGLLEGKITSFKSRLWVAWAMGPQILNMRGISLGVSARIDDTIGVTIPTMKSTIVAWLKLSEAEQAMAFNKAVEATYNEVILQFANAAKATIPAVASSLATPALDPRTVAAWSESLVAQADGVVAAIEESRTKRAELDRAMILGKGVIDAATNKVNQAQLEQVLAPATGELQLASNSAHS